MSRPPFSALRRAVMIGATAALTALPLSTLPSSAQADDFKVVTTFTIIADMARNVAGDAAEVVSITKPGAEIHYYQPTPGDIRGALDADLILWNGMNLEAWFEQFLRNLGDIPSAVVSDGIAPIGIDGADPATRPNPHAWMGLTPALTYVDNIAAAMATHDPDNAATYRANAEAYKAQIRATLEPLADLVNTVPEGERWLVSSEGAFSYLARDLGLRELYLWPINADQQGTPQQVRNVIDTVRAENIPVVFSESTVPDDAAKQVARETGARYGGILYVDSLSAADGPVPTYLDLLEVTVRTIVEGLTQE